MQVITSLVVEDPVSAMLAARRGAGAAAPEVVTVIKNERAEAPVRTPGSRAASAGTSASVVTAVSEHGAPSGAGNAGKGVSSKASSGAGSGSGPMSTASGAAGLPAAGAVGVQTHASYSLALNKHYKYKVSLRK